MARTKLSKMIIDDHQEAPNTGIEYADEQAPEIAAEPGNVLAIDPLRNRANQDAARKVVESMKNVDINKLSPQRLQPPVVKPTAAEAEKLKPRIYEIVGNYELARGGGRFKLPSGKRMTENEYDIEALKRQGVQLREV